MSITAGEEDDEKRINCSLRSFEITDNLAHTKYWIPDVLTWPRIIIQIIWSLVVWMSITHSARISPYLVYNVIVCPLSRLTHRDPGDVTICLRRITRCLHSLSPGHGQALYTQMRSGMLRPLPSLRRISVYITLMITLMLLRESTTSVSSYRLDSGKLICYLHDVRDSHRLLWVTRFKAAWFSLRWIHISPRYHEECYVMEPNRTHTIIYKDGWFKNLKEK